MGGRNSNSAGKEQVEAAYSQMPSTQGCCKKQGNNKKSKQILQAAPYSNRVQSRVEFGGFATAIVTS